MDQVEFQQIEDVHFIGIGGIGMSALAQHFYGLGKNVSGSDMGTGERLDFLTKQGVKIFSGGHSVDNLSVETDLVVISLAIPEDNPELSAARERGIQIVTYPEAMGWLTHWYKTIVIAGTHGKTTTTGMLAKVLVDVGLDPTVILGSTADFLPGGNYRHGESDWLILEACEYHGGFLHYSPDITVITNIEHDHFDAYPTEESYYAAFKGLIENTLSGYPIVLNTDYSMAQQLAGEIERDLVEYTKENKLDFTLALPGKHNRTNAQAVLKVAELLELDMQMVKESLSGFNGTARRFEFKGKIGKADVYSDYGHHPTEIKATLAAFREKYPDVKLAVFYQAHRHDRVGRLLLEFGEAFVDADHVLLAPIYAARESKEEIEQFTVELLAEEIKKRHESVEFMPDWECLDDCFANLTRSFDVVVVMTAGDLAARVF